MEEKLTILDLIKNNTLSTEMAALLWEAASEKTSFLTSSLYRDAGKSTLSKAVLNLRGPNIPIHYVSDNQKITEKLIKMGKPGGYLVVAEFNPVEAPGYIWGEKIKNVFEIVKKGYSLQSCIHAKNAEDAIMKLTKENGVSDTNASLIKLVLFIEMYGLTPGSAERRVSQIYEVHYVENGKPMGHNLYEWDENTDTFVKTSDPHLFVSNKENIIKRSQILTNYVNLGKTSSDDLSKAMADFNQK